MSDEQFYQLQEIAKMLIEARDKLENLQSWDLTGTAELESAISKAQWLCHRICQDAPFTRRRIKLARQIAMTAT
jgi:hypothetical protein